MRRVVYSALALLAAAGSALAAPFRVAGSDLLPPALREAMVRHASSEGMELAVDFKGSLPARVALSDGSADAALLVADSAGAASAETAEPRFGGARTWVHVPVASVAAFVIVAADNPVEQVDFHQLAALFGSRSELRRWGELGGQGVWNNRTIAPVMWSRKTSPVGGLFSQLVLQGTPPRNGMGEAYDQRALLDNFANQPGLIALAPFHPPADSGIRALKIARTPGFPSAAPTPDAIERGDYPLRLPIELVFDESMRGAAGTLARFFASAEAATALDAAALVPLSAGSRSRLAAENSRR